MFEDFKDNTAVSGYVSIHEPVPVYNDTDEHRPASAAPVCLKYKIARDKAFTNSVCIGEVFTSSDIDYTVKIQA